MVALGIEIYTSNFQSLLRDNIETKIGNLVSFHLPTLIFVLWYHRYYICICLNYIIFPLSSHTCFKELERGKWPFIFAQIFAILRLFLHSQRPKFLTGFILRRAGRISYSISLQLACWWGIFVVFLYLKMSLVLLWLLKDISAAFRSLSWQFFSFKHFEDAISLVSIMCEERSASIQIIVSCT